MVQKLEQYVQNHGSISQALVTVLWFVMGDRFVKLSKALEKMGYSKKARKEILSWYWPQKPVQKD